MTKTLDVYRDWLKIADADRPLNHYQLLRLKKFEDDTAKVREHYRAMNAHVRKFSAGEYAKQSQDLLNELARAMLCLTDNARKREYDASLGRKQAGSGKARSFEELLLAAKVVDQPALDKARNFSKAIGVDVRDALVQQKLAKYEAVLPAYAESIGLPYLDLGDIDLDPGLIAQVPPLMARQHSCVPVMIDEGHLLMASPNPLDPNIEEELRLRFGMSVRTVLCTPANINTAIEKFVARDGAGVMPTKPAAPPPGKKGAAAEAPAKTETKPAAPKEPEAPLTEEEKQQRQKMLFVAFGMPFTLTIVAATQFTDLRWFVWLPLALVIGAVVCGVASKVAPRG